MRERPRGPLCWILILRTASGLPGYDVAAVSHTWGDVYRCDSLDMTIPDVANWRASGRKRTVAEGSIEGMIRIRAHR